MQQAKRKGKYSAIIGCTLMLTMVYMSLTSWSVAVNELASSLSLSPIMVQAGASVLVGGYAIGSFVEGKMCAKIGWRKTFTYVIIPFIIASALIPVVTNYYIILLLRFIQGWGCMVSTTVAIITSWLPVKERGLALGIMLGAIGLGSALGGYIGGILTPILGWRYTFWVITALTIVGVITFYALVKEAPPLEEENIPAVSNSDGKEINIHKEPGLWILGIATLGSFFACYGMYAYLAQYLYTLNYSAGQVGLVVMFNGLIAVVASVVCGRLSDNLVSKIGAQKSRSYVCAWGGMFVTFVGCIILPHVSPLGIVPALIVAMVIGWGPPATNGPGMTLPADIFGSAASGPGVGLVLLVAGIGGVISPVFVPWLASVTSWNVAWYVTGGAALMGMIMNIVLGNYKTKAVASKAQADRSTSLS